MCKPRMWCARHLWGSRHQVPRLTPLVLQDGETALMSAAQGGQLEVVKVLEAAECGNAQNADGLVRADVEAPA